MLARKQSISGDPAAPVFADYGPDETLSEGNEVIWPDRSRPRLILRLLALLSLISVILNTPKTFETFPFLLYVTFVVDVLCLIAFFAEMVSKIRSRGLFMGDKAYFKVLNQRNSLAL